MREGSVMREILLVDDEPAITESLEYFLTQAGFSTRSAGPSRRPPVRLNSTLPR